MYFRLNWPLVAVLILTFGLSNPVRADDWSISDKNALKKQLNVYESALINGDFKTVIGLVPDRLVALISQPAGVSVAELKAVMADQTKAGMRDVNLISFKFDLEHAIFDVTEIGRIYALIPTTTIFTIDDTTLQGDSHTLAITEETVWSLIRVNNAEQIAQINSAYPDFNGVEFPTGSTRVVE